MEICPPHELQAGPDHRVSEQAAMHVEKAMAVVKVEQCAYDALESQAQMMGTSHLVAPCMTSAAEMLGSTASLAAGWAGTSEAGGRGRLEEITASRPQLVWLAQLSGWLSCAAGGGPAVRTATQGCCITSRLHGV